MDFQSLSRKDLQTLCKKNKIPANITNVAMAEALAALQQVAGIEEFFNPIESEFQQSEERIDNGSPGNSRTACRTSTRRKPVNEEPPTTQSIIRTRRGKAGEMADQENKDLNISSTLFPSNRRRAPVPSARKKLETQQETLLETQLIEEKEEENDQSNGDQKRSDVLETPSMPKTQRKLGSTRRKAEARMDTSSVKGACSTRRSMRLLEKNMENLSLTECGSVEPFVADKLFDELPERKVGENASEEDDSKETLGLGIDESDDPEGMNETKDKEEEQAKERKDEEESKEKVEMEDNIMTDKDPQAIKDQCEPEDEIQSEAAIEEQRASTPSCNDEHKTQSEAAIKDQCEPEDEIQSEAAIEEQRACTPSCNDEFSTEKLSEEWHLAAQSPFIQEKANLDITMHHEVLKENSEFITEKTVEINIEDLVDSNTSCQSTCNAFKSQDSISEPKMEDEVLSEGDYSTKEEIVESDFGELIDVNVVESELVENSIQETQNFEEQVSNFNSKDSFPEPKMEDLSKSENNIIQELPYEENSFTSFFTSFAVDRIPGQLLHPTAEVSVKESRTSLKILNSADQVEDMKNNSNDDGERDLSLRQLRKMIKKLHLSKKSNKEKTYGQEQVGQVVRTALQPLSENCMAKDEQEKTTTANSMF